MTGKPSDRAMRVKYATYCRLTCIGGSEKGLCPCESGLVCELRYETGFSTAMRDAQARMFRWVKRHNGLTD